MNDTPRTSAALAATLEACGRLGPEHAPLADLCRKLERETASRSAIITERIDPPVLTRAYDWCAYVRGQEEAGEQCCAYGQTEAEALRALAEKLWDLVRMGVPG